MTPGKPLREKEGTENLSIWFDPERRVDRVAAAYEDSLFVFEVDESGSSSLLLADGFGDNGYGPNVVFLEPGHLYYADGTDRAWLRHGANLEHRREIELSQIQAEDLAVATSGDGWAEVDWDGMVSYGTNMQAGFSAPGSQLPGEFGGQIAINDTHIYTGKWIEGTQRFYTFERTSPPTPVDSLDVELTAWRFLPWSLERDFLVTDDAVLDLSDPGHPSLVGSVAPPPSPQWSLSTPAPSPARRPTCSWLRSCGSAVAPWRCTASLESTASSRSGLSRSYIPGAAPSKMRETCSIESNTHRCGCMTSPTPISLFESISTSSSKRYISRTGGAFFICSAKARSSM